jgi:SAM-dependent methyltransferase
MKQVAKRIMRSCPAVFNPLWSLTYPWIIRRDEKYVGLEYDDRADAFRTIYEENRWASAESRSGHGSTLAYTEGLRKSLTQYLRRLKVKRFLDAPCGDFNWMRHVALPPAVRYIGGDIVPEMIEGLQRSYGAESRSFCVIDIVKGPLPHADLWLCRDVLFHLPNNDIATVLANFAASDISFFLTTTYDFAKQNADVRPGGFRFINLRLAPFGLPRPLAKIPDFVVPEPPRYLALWSRAQVARSFAQKDFG